MKKTALLVMALGLFAFATAGCEDTYKASSTNDNNTVVQETNTPLGCDRDNNRYYDFIETRECLRPTTYEQLYVLDKFRFFNQLVSETPDEVINIRVGFKTSIDSETYERLIVLEDRVVDITSINLFYPLLDQNGLGGLYQPRSNEIVARNEMLQAAHDYSVTIYSGFSDIDSTPLYDRQDMETYSVDTVEVTMKTSDVPIWWEGNKEQVRYVQSLITDIDPAQTPFAPRTQIVPRGLDSEIDWDNQ